MYVIFDDLCHMKKGVLRQFIGEEYFFGQICVPHGFACMILHDIA